MTTPISVLLSSLSFGPCCVAGWITSIRKQKRLAFAMVSDGSSLRKIQVVLPSDLWEKDLELSRLTAGCAVYVSGELQSSKGPGQDVEILATSLLITGFVEDPETYPIQPKELSPEFLRTLPHLRARTAYQGAMARLRHKTMMSIHEYFSEKHFFWVQTPILSAQDAEGAGSRFEVFSPSDPAFFDEKAYLTVSGQLAAESLCMALSRVYTFGPTFRAEPSQTSRHLAEFWMVEPEVAFADLDDIVALSEGLLKKVMKDVLEKCPEDMAFFEQEGGLPLLSMKKMMEEPFERVTYKEAIEILQKHQSQFEAPIVWGMDLSSVHEKWLVDFFARPVFVTHYPADIKSFYMKPSGDQKTVLAMDLLVPQMGGLVGGSVRETDKDALVARMKHLGMDPECYRSYLDLRRYGSAPHAGFGLGFERLLGFLSGAGSVRDVIPFPRYKGSIRE